MIERHPFLVALAVIVVVFTLGALPFYVWGRA